MREVTIPLWLVVANGVAVILIVVVLVANVAIARQQAMEQHGLAVSAVNTLRDKSITCQKLLADPQIAAIMKAK